jgi:hypothetical protein
MIFFLLVVLGWLFCVTYSELFIMFSANKIIEFLLVKYVTTRDILFFVYDYCLMRLRFFVSQLFGCGMVTEKDGYIEITYFKNATKYKIIAPKCARGPRPIRNIKILHGGDTDMTRDADPQIDKKNKLFEECMGPYGNFHGIPTTPEMMGICDDVIVTYRGGTEKIFKSNEVIDVK